MIARLWHGCWLSHGHRYWTRTESGVGVLRCENCNHDLPILATEAIKGPAHEPKEVRGQPKTRTFQEAKLSKIRRVG